MKLHRINTVDIHLIRACTDTEVRIDQTRYASSLLVTPSRIVPKWRPTSMLDLRREDLQAVMEFEPEIVLLGTGRRLRFPPAAIRTELHRRAIGLEVMDTAAACRTYNILAAEGRNVVAALLISDDA